VCATFFFKYTCYTVFFIKIYVCLLLLKARWIRYIEFVTLVFFFNWLNNSGFCYRSIKYDESLERLDLFSSCQNLEEVYLSCNLRDHDLRSLTQCKNLKNLYFYVMEFLTFDTCSVLTHIFEQCPKLQGLYFIHCKIKKRLLNQWRKRHPHVSIFFKTRNYLRYQREGEYIDIDI